MLVDIKNGILCSPSRTLQYLDLSQYSPDLSSRFYPILVLCLKCVAVLQSLPQIVLPQPGSSHLSPESSSPPFLVHYPTDSLAGLSTEIISAFFPDSAGSDFMLYFCFSSVSGYTLQCTQPESSSAQP